MSLPEPVATPRLPTTVGGTLHVYVAFDWGDEIDLGKVGTMEGAWGRPLPRRRRTPSSIEFRPPPVRLSLEPISLDLAGLGLLRAQAEAAVFDFGGVSVSLQVPFQLPTDELVRLAGSLADPAPIVRATRQGVEPLFRQLLPAIHDPLWSDLVEDYFVFQLPPGNSLPLPSSLLDHHAIWLAGLTRLEAGPLSEENAAEASRLHFSYSPEDLFVADWPAALLIDVDCQETLQAIEYANLQLLEYRHIDQRLDDSLSAANRVTRGLPRTWMSFWRNHRQPLRDLGQLKVEAAGLYERTGNVLKLVGDQYLARVYRLLANRFHLHDWEGSIQRKVEVLEAVYQVLSDQASTFRAEFLEWTVVGLIAMEIILALWRR